MRRYRVISRGLTLVGTAEGSIEPPGAGTAAPHRGAIFYSRNRIFTWKAPRVGGGGGGGGFQAAWAIGSNVVISGAMP